MPVKQECPNGSSRPGALAPGASIHPALFLIVSARFCFLPFEHCQSGYPTARTVPGPFHGAVWRLRPPCTACVPCVWVGVGLGWSKEDPGGQNGLGQAPNGPASPKVAPLGCTVGCIGYNWYSAGCARVGMGALLLYSTSSTVRSIPLVQDTLGMPTVIILKRGLCGPCPP